MTSTKSKSSESPKNPMEPSAAESLKNTMEPSAAESLNNPMQPSSSHQNPTDKSALAESVTEMVQAITNVIKDASSSPTPSNNLPPSSTPDPVAANAPPAADPMPQSVVKVHAVFYALITMAVLLLKSSYDPQKEEYQPLLNYRRLFKISVSTAMIIDICLVAFGLSYGVSQVVAEKFRKSGKMTILCYDMISIYLGMILVSALMYGVSIFCGAVVTFVMIFVLIPILLKN